MSIEQFRAKKRRLANLSAEPMEIELDEEMAMEDNNSDDVELTEGSLEASEEEIDSAGQAVTFVPQTDEQPKKKKRQSWSPEFRYKQFVGRGTELFILTKDENGKFKEEPLANLVYIKEIHENIDEQTFELVLRYWYMNQWRELTVKRFQLQLNELTKLLNHGIDVPNFKAGQVAKFLSLQEKDAQLKQVHHKLGWAEHNGALIYKHQKILGSNLPYSSTYVGKLFLQNGTFEGWKDVIVREVLGHIPLEFALVCGFASPLVALIARIVDMGVLIFHAYGDSSQGKTTAGGVFVSPFGLPSKQEGGLILQWYGTKNGIVAQIADKHGLPIVLDEATMSRMKDFTDFLYLLAEGREKARMTKEIEERKRASWSGVFFSTAEHSLHMKSNQNSGLIVRLQEKGNVPWTRSAENADNIKAGLLQHYGHAGPMFVEFLIKKGKDTVVDVWKKWAKICYQKMEMKDSLSNRMADKYALILATAELMNECFDFKVNIDGILDFLLEMDQENIKGRDLGERAYQYLKQMVIQHQMNFMKTDYTPKGEIWGKITRCHDRRVEVAFLQEPFKKLLSDGGFDDCSVVLRKLKEKGYLDHERDKNTRKRNIDPSTDKRELVYCVLFDKSFENLLNGVTLTSSQVKSTPRKTSGHTTVYPPDDKDFPNES